MRAPYLSTTVLRQQDSGAGWTSNWTGAVAGIGANLVYPGLNSGGYAAAGPVGFPGALRDLPPQTTGVVYLSALVSGTSYANVTLYNGGTELIGRRRHESSCDRRAHLRFAPSALSWAL